MGKSRIRTSLAVLMKIALIPARGNSKRIKNKNIKDFCGKPIIAYAIKLALESKLFDKVFVSTDSKDIANISIKYGASIHSLRPKQLSDDFATTIDVIKYEINNLSLNSDDIICCIYPTTPLLQYNFLKQGLDKLNKDNLCFSACKFDSNPLRGFFIRNEEIVLLNKELENTRSQDIESIYYDAGQFYCGYVDTFLNMKSIFNRNSKIILIPSYLVVDINTQEDWDNAELKYKICKQ